VRIFEWNRVIFSVLCVYMTCKRGMILRRAYTRKNGVRVKSACIKDLGKPGKGSVLIGPLKSGELKKYGYSLKLAASRRHSALKKSVKAYGRGTLIKKLNALRVLHKNTHPVYSHNALNDLKYVQRNF
jgi:hypothetical protein